MCWLIKGLGVGGAERLLVTQAEVGDRRRIRYRTAFLVPDKDALAADLEALGVVTTCLRARHWWDLRWAWRLRRALRDQPVDVLHVHSPSVAAIARIVVRSLGRRPALVYTEHNRWSQYRSLTRWLNRATYGLDDVQLAVSEGVRQSVAPAHRDAVRVVIHGVDLDHVRAQRSARASVREELAVPHDGVVVGTVANLRPEKDYRNLMAAAATVLDHHPTVRFVAIGDGPLEGRVRAWHAELGLGDRFVLLGHRPDAVRLMSGFDVFALGSAHEGLPVSVMEALSLGTPVVATAVGGLPEAVRDGIEGRTVPAHRPDLLAEALGEVVADGALRARMAAAALVRSECFSATRSVEQVELVYRQVARCAA